jgi:hypothetical protein
VEGHHLRQFPRPQNADHRPAEGDEAMDADDDLEQPERVAEVDSGPLVTRHIDKAARSLPILTSA